MIIQASVFRMYYPGEKEREGEKTSLLQIITLEIIPLENN